MKVFLFFVFFVLGIECFQLTLHPRETYRQQVIRTKNWPEFRKINRALLARYRRSNPGEFSSTSQPFYDYADQEFNVKMSIGTPGTTFELLVETSASNTWVVDKNCSSTFNQCPLFCRVGGDYCRKHCDASCCNSTITSNSANNASACDNKTKFDSTKSSTYQSDGRAFQLMFGLGNVTGILGRDTVTLGDPKSGSSIKVPNTTFGQAQGLGSEFGQLPLDGFLGLAFRKAAADDVQPVFEHALELKLFDQPVFTIWLPHYSLYTKDKAGGALSFGSRDPKNCANDAKFVPLASEFIWWINVDIVTADGDGGSFKDSKKQKAIISLGTSMYFMSYSDLMSVVRASNANYNFKFAMYEVPCNVKFSWSFFVGSNKFTVEGKEFIWSLEDGTCLLAITGWGDAPHPVDLVFGVPLFRQFCVTFDVANDQVGFATRINGQ